MFNYRKVLKYLLIPGLIMTVAGLIAEYMTKSGSILYVSLIVTGSIFLIIWLLSLLIVRRSFWQRRSSQAGTNALVSTLSLMIILGIINFLAVRYLTPIDLTENQLFTVSSQTQKIVKNINEPIKVWLFVKDPNPRDKDLLENYRRYNEKFEFEFIDPDTNLGLTKRFNVNSLGDVYLEYRDKKQLVQTLIQFNTQEPLSEIKLTNAIEKIQRNYIPTVYFLQGHGEYSLEESHDNSIFIAVNSLKNKGYNIEPLNLVTSSKIPDDADAIIIAGSQRKLFEQEVKALEIYSDQGGNLLLLLNPNIETGLETILEKWGVKLDNRVVIDSSGRGNLVGLGPVTPLINTYGNHPITKEFKNGISFYPLARPIDTIKVENVEATSLLIASEKMWAESNVESEEFTFDETQDIAGPFDLGVVLIRQIDPNKKQKPQLSPSSSQLDKDSPIPSQTEKQIDKKLPKKETKKTTFSFPKEIEIPSKPNSSSMITPSEGEKFSILSPYLNKTKVILVSNILDIQDNDYSSPLEKIETQNNDFLSEENHKKTILKSPETIESRLVIIGNSMFITNNLFNQQLNGDVFLNSVQWLVSQDDKLLSIRPKEAKNRRINLTTLQAGLLTFLTLVFFPLGGFIAGFMTWLRRR
ncbi:ABC transporter [cyanobacterium endosymbiont of Rhopalodia gibberula]|uniref:GldG family protein n=1 Tax=cyanobacterium endosymbiont of Rhopalodia gibberula TaxID=1763363 RepID=UPI000DC72F62|nr:Gldg family protein [cyanobacterium endosymbiont of Rhopalodia gibberula]BBA79878.1 ABC transporter [cyanobacterium endosymbiont of Rhopalodia gibberula]